jgi:hypothetical protein
MIICYWFNSWIRYNDRTAILLRKKSTLKVKFFIVIANVEL